MINKINFTGKVYTTPYAKMTAKKSEIKEIQQYADTHDVDVFLYNRSPYIDNVGAYSGIVSKNGKIWQKTFDLKHSEKSILREIPGQEVVKDDIIGFLDGKYDLKETNESVLK